MILKGWAAMSETPKSTDGAQPSNEPLTPTPEAVPEPPAGGTAPAANLEYDQVPRFANGKPSVDAFGEPIATQSRLAAAILCWFLGVFGIHRFYVGKIGTGILMIVTLGGLGIWVLIDFIMILIGSFRNKEGLRLYNW